MTLAQERGALTAVATVETPDVRVEAPADGPVTFSSCGSDHDTVLAVYTGTTLGGLTRLAADDDSCELGARTGVLATAGTTYRIALDGFHGAGGTATLTWD